jgi:hypothetical protein
MMITCYAFGQKYFPVPYQLTSGFLYITITYLLVIAVNSMTFSSQIIATACHLAVIVGCSGVAFVIERKELTNEMLGGRSQ